MSETMQLYVKNTSNCAGLFLQTFELLGPTWSGDMLDLPFGEPPDVTRFDVVGWTDLFFGQACQIHVARVRWLAHDRPDISGGPGESQAGYLVWGGNSGVRILDPNAEPTIGIDDHLPRGHGRPVVWIDAVEDLPDDVRAVVEATAVKLEVVKETGQSKFFAVLVTLRQAEAHHVELNSNFGIDADEHADLLDDPDILRAVFGVVCDGSNTFDYFALDTYCAHLGREATWENALREYHHAQGHVERRMYQDNLDRVEALVKSVVGADELKRLMAETRQPFEDWLKELAEENDDDDDDAGE